MFIKRVLYGQKDNQAAPPSKPDCNTRDFIPLFEADKSSWEVHTEDPLNPSSKVLELIGPECNSRGVESPSNLFEAGKSSCEVHIEDFSNPCSKALELIGPECYLNGLLSPSNHFEADKSTCKVLIEESPNPSNKVLEWIGPLCNLDGLLSPSNHFEVVNTSCEVHNEDSVTLISQVLEPIGPECNSRGMESPSNLFEADKSSCEVHIEDTPNPCSKALELIGPKCNLNGLLSPFNHFEADKSSSKVLIEESPNPNSRVLEPIGPECNSSGMAPPPNLFETNKSSCKAHIEESPNPSSKVLELIGPQCNLNGLLSHPNHFEVDKSSCKVYVEDSSNSKSQVLELINPKCNCSGMIPPSNLFEADKSSCEAHIEDSPHPSSKVLELLRPWRENRWQLEGRSVHIHKMKCKHFHRWFLSAGQCWVDSITPASATREFCVAVERTKYLVEECSHDEWLLKAVELWECTEHFVEVLLDLCWSAYIMHLVVGSIEWSKKWISNVEELLRSRSEQNYVAKLFHETCNENDKNDLEAMVEEKLADRTLKVDCPEHQLANLLRDRLKNQSLWRPPFLKRHRFFIYWDIIALSQRSSKTGAHGAILKFSWVYGKEFAMKMRHPNEDGQKTFKREFDILDKYRSPYIVGVVGYWEVESWASWNPFTPTILCPFLLMENLEFDFKDLMDRCKTWYNSVGTGIGEGCSELDSINLILPVAKALRFLHEKDLAHRDVKPQNIMCKNVNPPRDFDDIIVKLIDFGEAMVNVSKLKDGEWGRAGTSGYMDPTMWKQKQDPVLGYTLFMGDVFSFAMVFAELLTWKSPSEAFGVQRPRDAQIRLNVGERPPLPNGLQDYVRFIVESCWHVDHLKRPDFDAICSMLLHARMLLLDKDLAYESLEDLFSYEDATGGERCISDQE